MQAPRGYACVTGPDGIEERTAVTCGHCQRIFFVRAKARPEDMGGYCRVCDRAVCQACVKTGRCEPFEEKVARVEKTQDMRRWLAEAGR